MRRAWEQALRMVWALAVLAVLVLLGDLLGCAPKKEEDEPKAYYGPPPTDAGPVDAAIRDARAGADACEPAAYYGPAPCADTNACVQQYGPGWYCDTANTFPGACGQPVTWPVCVQGKGDGGRPDACEPAAYYGPPPCQSNAECVQQYGAGWYCDQGTTVVGSCGEQVAWPACVQGPVDGGIPDASSRRDGCEPAAYYGPPPCQGNDECVQRHGTGWYCDQGATVVGPCGEVMAWPVCEPGPIDDGGVVPGDGGEPPMYYGPLPRG